jgi:hypothetical protein
MLSVSGCLEDDCLVWNSRSLATGELRRRNNAQSPSMTNETRIPTLINVSPLMDANTLNSNYLFIFFGNMNRKDFIA